MSAQVIIELKYGHGNYISYLKGCRCAECTAAWKLNMRSYRARTKERSIARAAEKRHAAAAKIQALKRAS